MSLFSSLSPPQAAIDELSGLPYMQALRAHATPSLQGFSTSNRKLAATSNLAQVFTSTLGSHAASKKAVGSSEEEIARLKQKIEELKLKQEVSGLRPSASLSQKQQLLSGSKAPASSDEEKTTSSSSSSLSLSRANLLQIDVDSGAPSGTNTAHASALPSPSQHLGFSFTAASTPSHGSLQQASKQPQHHRSPKHSHSESNTTLEATPAEGTTPMSMDGLAGLSGWTTDAQDGQSILASLLNPSTATSPTAATGHAFSQKRAAANSRHNQISSQHGQSGSQTARLPSREKKHPSISTSSGNETNTGTHTVRFATDEKSSVSFPPIKQSPSSSRSVNPSPSPPPVPVLQLRRDDPTSFLVRRPDIKAILGTRTLEDELLELEREKRSKIREKKEAELGLRSKSREGGGGGDDRSAGGGEEKSPRERTPAGGGAMFPPITPGGGGSSTSRQPSRPSSNPSGSLTTRALPSAPSVEQVIHASAASIANKYSSQLLPNQNQLPFAHASGWENSGVQIDLGYHYQMFADKVADYTHRLTQNLQGNLEKIMRKIRANEQIKLHATRNQMRELMRFYHSHEGEMFDMCHGLKEEERTLSLAELEHEELEKQQLLIHEDYQLQHSNLIAQLYALHQNHGKNPHAFEYMKAHSKKSDAQGARLASRKGSKSIPINTPLLTATNPTPVPQLSNASSSAVPSSSNSGRDSGRHTPTSTASGSGGEKSKGQSPRRVHSPTHGNSNHPSPRMMPDNSSTFDSQVPSIDISQNSSRRNSRRASIDGNFADANFLTTPTNAAVNANGGSTEKDKNATTAAGQPNSGSSVPASANSSAPSTASGPAPPPLSSPTNKAGGGRRTRRNSSISGGALSATEAQQEQAYSKLHHLRNYWQGQFSSARRDREQLKQLKSELIEMEKELGTKLEMEKLKVQGLSHQLVQMGQNHVEQLSKRNNEVSTLSNEQQRLADRSTGLQNEYEALERESALALENEEIIYGRIHTLTHSRLELNRANENVFRELEREYYSNLEKQNESLQSISGELKKVQVQLYNSILCEKCKYQISSAAVTWETGESSCEKCAFQILFPQNFQAVVNAVHKQISAGKAQASSASSLIAAATANAAAAAAAHSQSGTPRSSSRARLNEYPTFGPIGTGVEQEYASDTPKTSTPTGHLRQLGFGPRKMSVVGTAGLKTHLEPTRDENTASELAQRAMGDLGARMLQHMTASGTAGDAALQDMPVATGERIRRGSLGGIVDVIAAITDAHTQGSDSPSSPTAGADDDDQLSSDAEFDDDPEASGRRRRARAKEREAKAWTEKQRSQSSTPLPSGTHSPRRSVLASPINQHMRLQELSEWNEFKRVRGGGDVERATRAAYANLPFSLLWMKNRVMDQWIARFNLYKAQLEDLFLHVDLLPALLAQFEDVLSPANRERIHALRKGRSNPNLKEGGVNDAHHAASLTHLQIGDLSIPMPPANAVASTPRGGKVGANSAPFSASNNATSSSVNTANQGFARGRPSLSVNPHAGPKKLID